MYEYIVFDLDGTISDPKEGIVKSFNHSLVLNDFEEVESKQIEKLIGPPLDYAFEQITGTKDKNRINKLVNSYRKRYAEIGYAENIIYKDMASVLTKIHRNSNIKMGVCTSKREDFAIKILELFEIKNLFAFINGGDIGIQKWQQIKTLISSGTISENSIMVGDRAVDLVAAHKNGISSAGVLWGYGSESELTTEKPKYIFSQPQELVEHFA